MFREEFIVLLPFLRVAVSLIIILSKWPLSVLKFPREIACTNKECQFELYFLANSWVIYSKNLIYKGFRRLNLNSIYFY